MLCRFCAHDFGEIGGREAVLTILQHVGKEHPTDLLNLCVRLPFEPVGGHVDGLVFEEGKNEKICPIRTPEMNKELLMQQADVIGLMARPLEEDDLSDDIEAYHVREAELADLQSMDLEQGFFRSKEDY